MMNGEIQYFQANFFNKASDKICCDLYNKKIRSKLGLLLCYGNPYVMNQIKKIEEIEKIIDRQIRTGNNRRALLFTCLLKKTVVELVEAVEKMNISL